MDAPQRLDPLDAEIINATITIAVAAGAVTGVVLIECVMHWDRDYEMIKKFRPANLFYFAARYIGVATMTTFLALDSIGTQGSGCLTTFRLGQVLGAFLFLACASIFTLRVASLYNNSIFVLLPLGIYAMGIFAYTVYGAMKYLDATQSPFGIQVCNCDISNSNFGLVYLLDGSFDVTILILTVTALLRKVPAGSRLRNLLIGDQVLYVVAVSVLYFVAGICYYTASKLSQFIISLVVLALSSTLVCRLFLRLRDFGNQTPASQAKHVAMDHLKQEPSNTPTLPVHRMAHTGEEMRFSNASFKMFNSRPSMSPPPAASKTTKEVENQSSNSKYSPNLSSPTLTQSANSSPKIPYTSHQEVHTSDGALPIGEIGGGWHLESGPPEDVEPRPFQ